MNDDKFLSQLSNSKLARAIAWICVFIIIGLIIATLITGITGSPYFLGCLALCITVPILIYVMLWMGKVLHNLGARNVQKEQGNDKK